MGSPCNENNGNCGDNAACTTDDNLAVVCVCKVGFAGDGVGCSDVNECETGQHDCSKKATCTNFEGGFTCACNKGFFGDGKTCTSKSAVMACLCRHYSTTFALESLEFQLSGNTSVFSWPTCTCIFINKPNLPAFLYFHILAFQVTYC